MQIYHHIILDLIQFAATFFEPMSGVSLIILVDCDISIELLPIFEYWLRVSRGSLFHFLMPSSADMPESFLSFRKNFRPVMGLADYFKTATQKNLINE